MGVVGLARLASNAVALRLQCHRLAETFSVLAGARAVEPFKDTAARAVSTAHRAGQFKSGAWVVLFPVWLGFRRLPFTSFLPPGGLGRADPQRPWVGWFLCLIVHR